MTEASAKESFSSALEFERQGNLAKALEIYFSLAEKTPPFRPAIINAGSLYSRMGNFSDALVCYKKALEIAEDNIVLFNIGSALYRTGKYKEAVFTLEKSRRIDAGFVLPVLVMGLSYSKLGKLTAAAGCFSDALTVDASNEVALTALAMIYYETKKINLALHYAEEALKKNPSSLNAKKIRSRTLMSFGRNEESAALMKEVIKKDRAFIKFDRFIGSVGAEKLNDKHGSLSSKIESLEAKIENAKPRDKVALSLCCLFNGESDRAVDYLIKARG